MNLLKSNKLGVLLCSNPFYSGLTTATPSIEIKNSKKMVNGRPWDELTKGNITLHNELLEFKCQKILRISESIYSLSKNINIDSIYDNIEYIDMKFDAISILMPNDNIGYIQIKRLGSEIFFIWVYNMHQEPIKYELEINIYNFYTKNFTLSKTEKSEFVLKILTYLFYGDVKEKECKPKTKTHFNSFNYIKNETNNNIWYADSLWKTKISLIGEFNVRGHFRLQPHGENRIKKKLIFIDEYIKHGYHRNATIEYFNNDINTPS